MLILEDRVDRVAINEENLDDLMVYYPLLNVLNILYSMMMMMYHLIVVFDDDEMRMMKNDHLIDFYLMMNFCLGNYDNHQLKI